MVKDLKFTHRRHKLAIRARCSRAPLSFVRRFLTSSLVDSGFQLPLHTAFVGCVCGCRLCRLRTTGTCATLAAAIGGLWDASALRSNGSVLGGLRLSKYN